MANILTSAVLLIWIALIVQVPHLNAAPTDTLETWDPRFALPGLRSGGDASVQTKITDFFVDPGGHVYAAGEFSTIGTTVAPSIARWNGSRWTALADSTNHRIAAVTTSGSRVFATGPYFLRIDGVDVHGIGVRDGRSWAPLGAGIDRTGGNETGVALAADEEMLYMGGLFSSVDGVAAGNIAAWDGNRWSSLGSGVNEVVRSMIVDDAGRLFAAGSFTMAGDDSASGIAMWDGVTWHPLGGGLRRENDSAGVQVIEIVFDERGHLYAGGRFEYAGGVRVDNVARWDGSRWHSVGAGVDGEVRALAFDPEGTLFAAGSRSGYPSLARWDGARWTYITANPDAVDWQTDMNRVGLIEAIAAPEPNLLMAGGQFIEVSSVPAYHLALWDGEAWSPPGEDHQTWGRASPVTALHTDPGGTVFVGHSTTSGYTPRYSILKLGGQGWEPVGSGLPMSRIHVIERTRDGTLYAGGRIQIGPEDVPYDAAEWDGDRWIGIRVGDQIPPAYGRSVRSLSVDSIGTLYLGGCTNYFSHSVPFVAERSGGDWTVHQFTGSGSGCVETVLLDDEGRLFAGGWFTGTPDGDAQGIAVYDGVRWSALRDGVNGGVLSLGLGADGAVYAGGSFTRAGDTDANNIARWDGEKWTALGGGIIGSRFARVHALEPRGPGLFVAGRFSKAGAVAAEGVAFWDGEAWHPLGGGVDGTPAEIEFAEEGLYLAGNFSMVGEYPSSNIALWKGGVPAAPNQPRVPEIAAPFEVYPNPASGRVSVTIAHSATSHFEVALFDMLGRKVANLFEGRMPPNPAPLHLDLPDLPAGNYILSAIGSSTSSAKLITVLPSR